MSFSGFIAVLALAAAAVFAVFNQPLLFEARDVALPGGTYTIPLVGALLTSAAAMIILMLLGEAGAAAARRVSLARVSRRLSERDRELADLKTAASTPTGVEHRIDEVREELSGRIDSLARMIESRFPAQTTVRDTMREDADHGMIHGETTVTRRG